MLAGDFNLPDICWEGGLGRIKTSPAYGNEINNLFIDILNDFALEQQVKEPTRSAHILDLVLSSQPQLISDVSRSVILGMSDHEAVNFQLNLSIQRLPGKQYRKVRNYQYHKANQLGIKEEMERYQQALLSSDPYEQTVEENWSNFKETVIKVMDTHIPCKTMRPHKDILWLNHYIKSKMRERKKLYDLAKASQNPNDWHLYRKARNNVSLLKSSHHKYCCHLFNDTYSNNCKRFRSFIKRLRKDNSGISSLRTESGIMTASKNQAKTLN